MRAIFEPHHIRLDPIPGETDLEKGGIPRAFDDHLETITLLHRKGNPADPDPETTITPGVLSILNEFETEVEPIPLPATAYAPITRDSVHQTLLAAAEQKLNVAREHSPESAAVEQLALDALRLVLDAEQQKHTSAEATDGLDLAKRAAVKQAEAEFARSDYQQTLAGEDEAKQTAAKEAVRVATERLEKAAAGEVGYQPPRVTRKALETAEHNNDTYTDLFPEKSSGRRTSLARWLIERRNPLTARVAVNHVWLRHFGQPLVDPVDDFGLRTPRPEHLQLLDFLACELIDSGWSLKHLHRLMVNSKTYQLSSMDTVAELTTVARDPGNVFYWRMPVRRMESQVVRDSLLTLAGQLDQTVGGPSLDPGPSSRRRSLYFKHSRDQQDQFLAMFDDADHLQCYRRTESIKPQQALALTNSPLSFVMAKSIAAEIYAGLSTEMSIANRNTDEHARFIELSYETILARSPTDGEMRACLEYCQQFQTLHADSPDFNAERMRTQLVHAILNHNDFITIR